MKNYIAGQLVKFDIWKLKREYFRDTDPKTVAARQELFPDGEPDTDTFVKKLAEYVKRQLDEEKVIRPEP